jgi:hypothetical protein
MAIMLSVVLIVSPLTRNFLPEYYFLPAILGTILLFAGTVPMGHTNLSADLRGVLGYAFVIELAFLCLQSFDGLIELYRFLRVPYKYIDYGLFTMLAGRLFWFVKGEDGRALSWPPFDFVRIILKETHSWHLLQPWQRAAGYGMMVGLFALGCVFLHAGAWFALPLACAFLAMCTIMIARRDEVDALDSSDNEANLRAEIAILKARLKQDAKKEED